MLKVTKQITKSKLQQSGFTALELLLVLAVIAGAIYGMIRLMSSSSDKVNSQQMVADVSAMVQNIHSAYASSANGYNSLSNQAAIDMKIVPSDLQVDTAGGTIKNQFPGGSVDIQDGDNDDSFTITYNGVPSSVCQSAITTLGSSSFLEIKVGDDDVYNQATPLALDPAKVGSSCSSSPTVNVTFTAN